MFSHIKTTLRVDDALMAQLRREAARQQRTLSELVEAALRLTLRDSSKTVALPTLPTFSGGGVLVDIADRDALYHAMGGQ